MEAEPAARVAARVRAAIGPERFARYFGGRDSLRLIDGRLEVAGGDRIMSGLLDKRFGTVIRDAAKAELGDEARVSFGEPETESAVAIGGGGIVALPSTVVAPGRAETRRGTWGGGAMPGRMPRTSRYRLEEFLVSDCNRLGYNAAVRLCGDEHGQPVPGLSPLFVHGVCGVGKTHLVQGLAQRFRDRHPGATVRVTTGEQFMNEFVGAIRAGGDGVERFRRLYRRCDLLCIDDVHFLASKQATQDELLHTFDEIDHGGARVVLVSDVHPRQIKKFSPQLVSRFQAGMVAAVQTPDPGLREKLVRMFATRRGLTLEEGAVQVLVGKLQTGAGMAPASIRDIEGMVTKLDAVIRLMGADRTASGPLSGVMVERALSENGSGDAQAGGAGSGSARSLRPVRIEHILTQVCVVLGVEQSDLGGKTRHKRVVLARAIITHLARALTTLSYPDIARAIGRPSHSTVITAYQRFQGQLAANKPLETLGLNDVGTLTTLTERLATEIRRVSAR